MPGAFAHLTLVNHLQSDEFMKNSEFVDDVVKAVREYGCFVDLGAVSPDYPYLALLSTGKQAEWAESMHLDKRNGEFIRALLDEAAALDGSDKLKVLAWCLGYISHAVMDMTVHPVIELKVGEYKDNQDDHRQCEMYQDVHIFQRLRGEDFDASEYLSLGVGNCSDGSDKSRIDPLIGEVWSKCLVRSFPELEEENGPPDINAWHNQFGTMVGSIATEGNAWGMIPFARHFGKKKGVVYCSEEELEKEGMEFIEGLETPEGTMDYDDLFDFAVRNVADAWHIAAKHALDGEASESDLFGPWHLDTGRDQSTDEHVYWNN